MLLFLVGGVGRFRSSTSLRYLALEPSDRPRNSKVPKALVGSSMMPRYRLDFLNKMLLTETPLVLFLLN